MGLGWFPSPFTYKETIMKFYLTANASQPISGINFEPYAIVGGSLFGVLATDDAEKVAKLDKLVETKGLTSITAEDYAACLKKRTPSFQRSFGLSQIEVQPQPSPIKLPVASPASNATEVSVVVKPVEGVDAALVVGSVEAPESAGVVVQPTEPAAAPAAAPATVIPESVPAPEKPAKPSGKNKNQTQAQ